ncbi:sigma-70 family RNA polymerase sigma factor [Chitinophaga sp. 212800010-3]|uniref:RNA polymerase sigma factor n=1 Tax=unclassified Chitinophaga TaxID=2619133 RepID=UPI002DE9503B|nr:RNA polymerase sigma-70 factor, ECF subfamily [Chitinophaga sp. 212800010-3]
MPEHPGDDVILMLLNKGNAGDAFELIFKKYYRLMWTKAYLGTGDPIEADDLVQSVLSSIWEKRLYLNIKGCLKTYLIAAIRNQVNDYHKIKQRVRRKIERYMETVDQGCLTDSTEARSAGMEEQLKQLQQQLHEVLREFPEQRQRAFNQVYMEQRKYHEVADNMGISINSLKTHLKIAFKTLRSRLHLPVSE